ncbi:MAG TPA: hypothetical protein VIM77_10355 [Mucilaginibacter sp.]
MSTTTKKKTAPATKAAPTPKTEAKLIIESDKLSHKKDEPKKPINDFIQEIIDKAEENGDLDDGQPLGKIFLILKCYIAGYSRSTIVKAGFNRSTVYRQCIEYEKLLKAPAKEYQGFPIFEARVERIMKTKKISRQQAIKLIYEKDLE